MAGFSSDIPFEEYRGAEIQEIIVGASSVQIMFGNSKAILLDYYGAVEDQNDYLYNLPLCGSESVQSLVNRSVMDIKVVSPALAEIHLSGGIILRLSHDDVRYDFARFILGDKEYTA